MYSRIDWVVISKFGKQIGAVGFIGDTAVVIVAFYNDYDADKSGEVGWGEWTIGKISPIGLQGSALVEVAMQARVESKIILRDQSFQTMAANLFLNFARGLAMDAVYAIYFSQAVSAIATPIAGRIASNMVAQFAIRKGMESAVKAAYSAAVR